MYILTYAYREASTYSVAGTCLQVMDGCNAIYIQLSIAHMHVERLQHEHNVNSQFSECRYCCLLSLRILQFKSANDNLRPTSYLFCFVGLG